jgi:hypothetical protein
VQIKRESERLEGRAADTRGVRPQPASCQIARIRRLGARKLHRRHRAEGAINAGTSSLCAAFRKLPDPRNLPGGHGPRPDVRREPASARGLPSVNTRRDVSNWRIADSRACAVGNRPHHPALIFAIVAPGLTAQGLSVSVAAGGYLPAGRIRELATARNFPVFAEDSAEYRRERTFAIAVNADLHLFRLTAAYAVNAEVNTRGFPEQDDIGSSSVLVVAGDVVMRSLPTVGVVQPYVIGGIGVKHQTFSLGRNVITYHELSTQNDVALHAGIGIELRIGQLRFIAEASDFLSQDNKVHWKTHDVFAMAGLRFEVF